MKPEFGNKDQIKAIQKATTQYEYEKRLECDDLLEYEYKIEVKCEGEVIGKFFALDNEDADNKLEEICQEIDYYDIDFSRNDIEISHSDFEETGKIQIAKNKQLNKNQLNLFGV